MPESGESISQREVTEEKKSCLDEHVKKVFKAAEAGLGAQQYLGRDVMSLIRGKGRQNREAPSLRKNIEQHLTTSKH